MTQEELFSLALQVQAPWFIKEMTFDLPQGQLDIYMYATHQPRLTPINFYR